MLLGFAALKLLPDRPAEAPWLSEDEKHALETKLAAEAETTRDAGYHALGDALTKPRVLVLALLYFLHRGRTVRHRLLDAAGDPDLRPRAA